MRLKQKLVMNNPMTPGRMKLITEQIENVEILVEERNGKKSLYIEGVFLQGDITNRNGRKYPMETLRKEVDRYTKTFIEETEHLVNWVTLMDQL